MSEVFRAGLVLGVVTIGALSDLRTSRIPNWLTGPAALAGLALGFFYAGGEGLLAAVMGWLIGCAVLLPFFWLRWLGAGDVKLIAAVGALGGAELALFTILWSGVAGGPIALLMLLRARRLGAELLQLATVRAVARPNRTIATATRLPFGPAIAIGAGLALGGARWLGG